MLIHFSDPVSEILRMGAPCFTLFIKLSLSIRPKPYLRMVKLRRMTTARQISAIQSAWAPSGRHAHYIQLCSHAELRTLDGWLVK